jgi:putative flavoprotein involved in K+ transport
MTSVNPERHHTIVIGAGQGGLAAAHRLSAKGIDFVVLDRNDRVGDQWRSRYDSLRLYSPARYDSLPGMRFPLPPNAYPTGNQMADYLEAYASQFDRAIRTGIAVDGLRRADDGDGYVVTAGDRSFQASNAIVAVGFFRKPHTPAFAADLDPVIRQFHADDYRRPAQLADGPVLVVGLSHSGADLAMEAAISHPVVVSGRSKGQLPFSVDSGTARVAWPLMKFVAWNVMTISTPVGRKMRPQIRGHAGGPLLRHRRPELATAGVELTDARTVGVQDGKPMLDDGRVLDVANVIWCTGYTPDFGWIQLPIFQDDGYPDERRGVVAAAPGLYFVGLPFQYAFTSMLVVGAGRDAAYVVDHLATRSSVPSRSTEPAASLVRP